MTAPKTLPELQERQRDHDLNHHHDIYVLSYEDRMNHYVHHFSKYVGRLSRGAPDDKTQAEQLERTIADGLIVAIAAANTLDVSLCEALEREYEDEATDVREWGRQLDSGGGEADTKAIKQWLFKHMAGPTGRMANLIESRDHLETVDTAGTLTECTVEIVAHLLVASTRHDTDPSILVGQRWDELESATTIETI